MLKRMILNIITKRVSCILMLSVLLCSCADLVVRDVHYEQFTGPNLAMKGTVKNRGLKTADASTTKLERKYNWSDPFGGAVEIATPSLEPDESMELPLWVFSPTLLPEPGKCMYVQVCADSANSVSEISENNNCLTRSFMNNRYCRSCDLCCDQALPSAFDWRNSNGTNWVTGVRDQANCGSCWAFSAVAAVEAKNNGERDALQLNPIDVSEQQLLSCPGGGGSCLGGWPSSALDYIRTDGIVGENTLSYTSTNCLTGSGNNQSCRSSCSSATISGCANPLLTATQCAALDDPAVQFGSNPPLWRIGSRHRVTGSTVDDIKRALVCHGPLSVVSNNWSHAVLLVGWGDDAVPSYITSILTPMFGPTIAAQLAAQLISQNGWSYGGWIIKNSWGTGWGSNGYGIIPFQGHSYGDIVNSVWYAQDVTRRN